MNYPKHFASMKKSFFLVRGMLGKIFFVLRGSMRVPAFRPSLLLSKGFALLPFKNVVEIAAVEAGRPVSMAMRSPKGRSALP